MAAGAVGAVGAVGVVGVGIKASTSLAWFPSLSVREGDVVAECFSAVFAASVMHAGRLATSARRAVLVVLEAMTTSDGSESLRQRRLAALGS